MSTAAAISVDREPSAALAPAETIRLAIFQPALPKYRLPVFQELNRRPGIQFKLFYSADEPVQNVEPSGFDAEPISSRVLLANPRLMWRQKQLAIASSPDFDVMMAGWNTRYMSLIAAVRIANRRGMPTVLWGHGYSKKENRAKRNFRDWVGNQATAVLFYGSRARNDFVRRHNCEQRAFVAPNSLDQAEAIAIRAQWLADPARLASFQRDKGLAQGPTLFFVSRLIAENRTDMLLDAASKLLGDFPTLRVVIVGDGPVRQALEQQAAKLGITAHVTFTGAIYNEDELAPYFLSSDLFVYPRNIGLSLQHAMGYGLPVVTTDDQDSWAPEVEALKPWMNGMFYRDGSVEDLTEVVRLILSDKERLVAMKQQALKTATQDYSVHKMVDGMEAAIRYAYAQRRR
ncbi:MAG: glycosyltransferase family 4 protein [Phycisphaerales bacterium]|nr:glycosyltransferase family 4 protein [Phycisphaerales bacterium]